MIGSVTVLIVAGCAVIVGLDGFVSYLAVRAGHPTEAIVYGLTAVLAAVVAVVVVLVAVQL